MKRISIVLVIVAVALAPFTASGQGQEKPPKGFLSVLKVGQPIAVKEAAGRYEIAVIDDAPAPLGYKVIEVGVDFLVVEDVAGITETRIPVYSIKAIVRLKVPRK